MSITLYAQPYDLAANGFYFDDYGTYTEKVDKLLNDNGEPVEEFEIQFIDGDTVDCEASFGAAKNNLVIITIYDCRTFDIVVITNAYIEG